MDIPRSFHLHMISDATGETLVNIAKAVRVQYAQVRAIEHLHPLVRSQRELERVLKDVEAAPGIVLYTIFDRALADHLEAECKRLNIPCVAALKPILQVFESYLGTKSTPTVGAQHVLDADYFRRIEALNFTMMHDDGHLPANLNDADVVLVGISRTSKTPTAIYLANRGIKTANVPLVPGLMRPARARNADQGASSSGSSRAPSASRRSARTASSSRRITISTTYVDREAIAAEIAHTRKLCARHGWPIIDVTRRSIEETAAAILRLYHDREAPVLEA